MSIEPNRPYQHLLIAISETYSKGRVNSFRAVNTILVTTYWHIGQHIVEFEQGGDVKAQYGDSLLEQLSRDLSRRYGKGFSLSNVKRFRQFYLTYSIGAELPRQLDTDNQLDIVGATVSHLLMT